MAFFKTIELKINFGNGWMDGRWRKGRTSFFQGRSWNKCLKNDVKVVFYKSVILNPDGSSLRKTSRREVIVGRSRTSPPCRCTRSLSWGVCCWMEPSAWTCRQIRWTTSAITSSRRWSTPIRWIAFLNCTNNLDAFLHYYAQPFLIPFNCHELVRVVYSL